MKLKLNQTIKYNKKVFTKDSVIEVDANEGVPTDRFWRRRLKDAEIDNCVEIQKNNKKVQK